MARKTNELAGIDKNFGKDALVGLVVGIGILFLQLIIPGIGTIGIPSVPQSLSSVATMFIVVVVLASLFETFFFFDVVLSFFKDKTRRFGLKMGFLPSAILASLVFASFHLSAYGGFVSASGAFVSSFIMGLVFSYERKFTNSNVPGIITHMVLNYWIAFGSLAIVLG